MAFVNKLKALEEMTNEHDKEVLLTYLKIAGDRIIQKAYPFRTDVSEVPPKYEGVQVEIACYLLNKRGAEGESYHSENGINRAYTSAGVPDAMLQGVTPFVGVI